MVRVGHFLVAFAVLCGSTQGNIFAFFRSSSTSQPFNIDHVRTLFSQSLQTDSDGNTSLRLDTYITAYTELARVFDFFGVVFSFARQDILSKLTTLRELRQEDRAGSYATFESMFAYEYSQAPLMVDTPGVSSNRWIHRALRFIARVVEEVKQENGEDLRVRVLSRYNEILAPYHNWFVQAAVRVALQSFPLRENFLDSIDVDNDAEGMARLTQTIAVMDQVYDHVQGLYDQYST